MNRFPEMIRNVNEGLDELIHTISKLNAIYESAEQQLSPMVSQFVKLLTEANDSVVKPVSVSGDKAKSSRARASAAKKKRPTAYRKANRAGYYDPFGRNLPGFRD